jgi:hypothetical protein
MVASTQVPGQFDDADDNMATPAALPSYSHGPSNCAHKTLEQDAEDGARELRARMISMDPVLLAELVRARQSAAGIVDAFPAGDKRFASLDSDDDDSDEVGSEDGDEDEEKRGGFEDEGEPCRGLLDAGVDAGPRAALARAAKEHGLDLVAIMDSAELDLFARIRLANMVRMRVRDGNSIEEVKCAVHDAVEAGSGVGVLADDAYLQPVVPGDVLLTSLESSLEDEDGDVAGAVHRGLELGDNDVDLRS